MHTLFKFLNFLSIYLEKGRCFELSPMKNLISKQSPKSLTMLLVTVLSLENINRPLRFPQPLVGFIIITVYQNIWLFVKCQSDSRTEYHTEDPNFYYINDSTRTVIK